MRHTHITTSLAIAHHDTTQQRYAIHTWLRWMQTRMSTRVYIQQQQQKMQIKWKREIWERWREAWKENVK